MCKANRTDFSFLYANVYGQPGVEKAISILKKEIAADAANLGVSDLKKINTSFVSRHSMLYSTACANRES